MAYFYPRSPRGERLLFKCEFVALHCISIHAPRVGSDKKHFGRIGGARIFLSTLPAWGATCPPTGYTISSSISIHAPRVGSDVLHHIKSYLNHYFYPRSPRGERLAIRQTMGGNISISIHAPRVGSDKFWADPRRQPKKFLSTLPAWGATAELYTERAIRKRFLSTLPAWGATLP